MRRILAQAGWWALSIGLFVAIWELAWAVGWADPKVLPPPHLFLGDLSNQAQYFDTSQVIAGEEARGAAWGVAHSVSATILRVLVGLALGFALAVLVGIGTRYFRLFGKLVLPSVTLLAPVSPLAWLPVAIYTFGTGNGPAVFLVFVAVFFIIVLATISEIDSVSPTYLNVARTMGASRAQTYRLVILPAILPGLFMILRLNLFAAWMIVLVAESAGVGSGLGQVIMIARNTFNSPLVFFTVAIIGIVGYAIDSLLRQVQKRMLYWLPDEQAALGR
jgi:NitT/TauT family transport system permease protein